MTATTKQGTTERSMAPNGCAGYTDERDTRRECDTPLRPLRYSDQCGACSVKEERAEESRNAAASLTTAASPARDARDATDFACIGWEDANRHHLGCATPKEPHLAKGRCRKCYARHAGARRSEREALAETPAPLLAPAPARPNVDPDVVRAKAARATVPVPRDEPAAEDAPGADVLHATAAATMLADAARATVAASNGPNDAPAAAHNAADAFVWEVFDTAPHVLVATEPRVTIVADGNCRINAPGYALWGREVASIEILYDRARGAVAFRPCDPALPHARRLREDKSARQCSLRAFRRSVGDLLPDGVVVARPRLVGGLLVIVVGE